MKKADRSPLSYEALIGQAPQMRGHESHRPDPHPQSCDILVLQAGLNPPTDCNNRPTLLFDRDRQTDAFSRSLHDHHLVESNPHPSDHPYQLLWED